MEQPYLNIAAFCQQFDVDRNSPERSVQQRQATRRALLEAWAHLEHLGLIACDIEQPSWGHVFVTRRGREAVLSAEAFNSAQQRAHFPATIFHAELRGAPYDAFVRGNFQQAISDAFRVVEIRVRDESRLKNSNGVPLMREAFDEEKGPLRSDSTDKAERQALSHLFAGASGWVRNPNAHRKVPFDDVTEAIEQLMFASMLLRIVDERAAANIPGEQ
jgi:uncharacterized protein (TIGR02391 family)